MILSNFTFDNPIRHFAVTFYFKPNPTNRYLSITSLHSPQRTTLPYRTYTHAMLTSFLYLRTCVPDYPSDRDGDFPTELGMGMGPMGNTGAGTAMDSIGAATGTNAYAFTPSFSSSVLPFNYGIIYFKARYYSCCIVQSSRTHQSTIQAHARAFIHLFVYASTHLYCVFIF